ncbi:hypothetical protein AGMMS49944_06860 [Spirochaetia bacterium]|nr:hypothetical protein AGMMS49944_06860 [Spirochaetia bacterium]
MNVKFEKEYVLANNIAVSVETTGYIEGDAGHGCYTKIVIADRGSTALFYNGVELSSKPLEIEIRGGCEYNMLIDIFKDIAIFMEKNNEKR